MKHTHRIYARLGFLLCAIAVALGAFGTHVLKEMIGDTELNTFDTGVRYQMFHALALILLAMTHRKFDEKKLDLVMGLFFSGILIFSGSLYLLATRNIWGNDSFRILGAITPLGGVCFIAGWLVLFFKGFLPEEEKPEKLESESHSRRHHHRKRSHSSSDAKPDKEV